VPSVLVLWKLVAHAVAQVGLQVDGRLRPRRPPLVPPAVSTRVPGMLEARAQLYGELPEFEAPTPIHRNIQTTDMHFPAE